MPILEVPVAHRWTKSPSPGEQRLDALHRYDSFDHSTERSFDLLAEGLVKLYRTPFALVTFRETDQQHFKATSGLDGRSIPLASLPCPHLLKSEGAITIGGITKTNV
ncbi:hypothetical protein ACFFLM_05245 [Deinococcus oregonensis]|uniref:Uncharacterized protein n=1 Tax=Deinococcus oregonensis TaxID=1805970 RepID=A0ABV6AV53_9DEIO